MGLYVFRGDALNVKFCKYSELGRIQYTADVPAYLLKYQGDDIILIEDDVTAHTHYVDLGTMTAKLMGEAPDEFHEFNYVTHVWEDPRLLDELKETKWAEIKAKRTEAEMGPFTYNNMVFDGDENAQRRLTNLISVSKSALASGQDFVFNFTLYDNTSAELHPTDFVAIEMAKVMAVNVVFEKARLLRVDIDAAVDKAALEQISW